MITTYSNREYRITFDGIDLIENALENPNLVQVAIVSGCTILVAPQKQYGIDYMPNGEYRSWYMQGLNTKLARSGVHYLYARLDRIGADALLLFSVNDYSVDGKINGQGEANEDYYYIKIGSITATDSVDNPTKDREITIDFGYLTTPAGEDVNDDGWRQLFEVTADDLIRPLKKFASYIVKGTLSIAGKIVLNDKQVSDIARQGDTTAFVENDEALPTTKLLTGKYLNVIRKVFLNKDREDSTDYVQTFKKGVKYGDFIPGNFGSGGAVTIDGKGDSTAEYDKMYIRKKAVFNQLSIMETELAGAEFLFNSSGARAKITRVEEIGPIPIYYSDGRAKYYADGKRAYSGGAYRCYFMADDGDTAVENRFRRGNLVRSQSFNIKAGVHEGAGNHYWWRLVVNTGPDFVDLSLTHCDEGSDMPKAGDVMVQLGDLHDKDFQAAIALSAYGNGAPRMMFHTGIKGYSMSGTDMFSLAYDKNEGESVLKNYGRAYIGDRKEENYLRLTKDKGLEIKAKRFLFSTGEDVGGRIQATHARIVLGLKDTGIDINTRSITVRADKFSVRNKANTEDVAVFTYDAETGKPLVKAENIDVENLNVKNINGGYGKLGAVTIIRGTIGGFTVEESRLVVTPEGGDDKDGENYIASLSSTLLAVQNSTRSARIGPDAISPYSGLKCAGFFSDTETDSLSNIGLYFDVRGANNYDNAVSYGNHALYIQNGDICGFRLRTRRIGSSETLSNMDNTIIAITKDITLTMPATSSEQDGHIIFIRNSTDGKVNIYGYISNQGNTDTSYKTVGLAAGDVAIMIFDGLNKKWLYNYTGRTPS